jgi:hypothetical protein
MTESGFHDGELAVQRRAGVHAQTARLGTSMLAIPDLGGGIGDFLAERDFAVISARDSTTGYGRLHFSRSQASRRTWSHADCPRRARPRRSSLRPCPARLWASSPSHSPRDAESA